MELKADTAKRPSGKKMKRKRPMAKTRLGVVMAYFSTRAALEGSGVEVYLGTEELEGRAEAEDRRLDEALALASWYTTAGRVGTIMASELPEWVAVGNQSSRFQS